jgi:hypothetical protein
MDTQVNTDDGSHNNAAEDPAADKKRATDLAQACLLLFMLLMVVAIGYLVADKMLTNRNMRLSGTASTSATVTGEEAWIVALAAQSGADRGALAAVADLYITRLCASELYRTFGCQGREDHARQFALAYAQSVATVMQAIRDTAVRGKYPPPAEIALAYMLYVHVGEPTELQRSLGCLGASEGGGGPAAVMHVIRDSITAILRYSGESNTWSQQFRSTTVVVSRMWAMCVLHAPICEKMPHVTEIIHTVWTGMQLAADHART